ncbi:MAG TPA: prolyl-tRNA synthetase associated domain-containing protein [Candidatus Ventrousia excrementavium]|uniref:Prolyl-tRNA synthetase associated domain-containing protein n=1 Tax=Candidatus Ventrousia excrementavium TaxID=2840961 RepID=A0A9D1LM98_9CLOT|nr:prolyl-tRNA synthetase associated domain-containing protein [Candidatus Ventrousia excrementavium]
MSDRSLEILETLHTWGVPYTMVEHEPALGMDDLPPIVQKLGPPFFRNLFLCNRQKTEFYLLLIVGDKPFRTAEVSKKLGVSRLSFGDADTLYDMLGVTPGAVNPLSLLFDPDKKIHLVIDSDILGWEHACMHPGVNTKSIAVSMDDFKNVILPRLGHEPVVLTLTGTSEPQQ